MKGACLLLLLLVASLGSCEGHLTVQNCTGEAPFKGSPATDVYYNIVRKSSTECMHYVWSTREYPTLYLAHTKGGDSCNCSASTYNKTAFPHAGSIGIPGINGSFSMAFIFTRLVEFNGTDKHLTVKSINVTSACNESFSTSNSSAYSQFRLNNKTIRWNFTIEDMTFKGFLNESRSNTSDKPFSFSIRINFPTSATERLKYFPKTLFTANSTTFDVISENYQFTKNIGKKDNYYSRLALEVVVLHGKNVKNGSILLKRTNDDEYTPSVFSSLTYNMSAPLGGFIQWKPISYQNSGRKSTASQQVSVLPTGLVEECQLKSVPEGLASALYGSHVNGTEIGNITRWFAVFGTPGDDSYIRPDYNTWTVVAGYGQIPEDQYSAVIIITIFVGVGVPAVLVVLGGVYVFIRKKPWENVRRMMNSKRGRGYSRLS